MTKLSLPELIHRKIIGVTEILIEMTKCSREYQNFNNQDQMWK